MQIPAPTSQHEWLARLVGDWNVEMPHNLPDGSEVILRNRETARMIGHFWLLIEGKTEFPEGGECHYQFTLGFNPETGRFVGNWIGSVMTLFWVYDGELSADGRSLILHSQGPFFDEEGGTTSWQDIITVEDTNHRELNAKYLDRTGNWVPMMHTRATRISL